MKSVSIFNLRDDLASYLNLVRSEGASLVVRRFGKPIAIILPYKDDRMPTGAEYYGFLPKNERGSAFVKRLRRSDSEKKRIEKRLS